VRFFAQLRYNFRMRFFGPFFFGEPFRPFSPPHLVALALILAANLLIVWQRRRFSPAARRATRGLLAGLMVLAQVSFIAWAAYVGKASLQTVLPLHLCSLFMWVSAVTLFTRSRRLFELSYFLGGGGALFALITPDIGMYNFPHFVFFHALIGHGALLTTQVYLIAVEGFRPGPRAVRRMFASVNLYILAVATVDALIGANYMFLAYKPDFPTPLDYLGPWPWYILAVELIALVVFYLMNLPFKTEPRSRKDREGFLI